MLQPQLELTKDEIARRLETTKINKLQQEHGGMCKDFKLSDNKYCQSKEVCNMVRDIDSETDYKTWCNGLGVIKVIEGERSTILACIDELRESKATLKVRFYWDVSVFVGLVTLFTFLFLADSTQCVNYPRNASCGATNSSFSFIGLFLITGLILFATLVVDIAIDDGFESLARYNRCKNYLN